LRKERQNKYAHTYEDTNTKNKKRKQKGKKKRVRWSGGKSKRRGNGFRGIEERTEEGRTSYRQH